MPEGFRFALSSLAVVLAVVVAGCVLPAEILSSDDAFAFSDAAPAASFMAKDLPSASGATLLQLLSRLVQAGCTGDLTVVPVDCVLAPAAGPRSPPR